MDERTQIALRLLEEMLKHYHCKYEEHVENAVRIADHFLAELAQPAAGGQEPRKAREWTLCKNSLGWHATPNGIGFVNYRGEPPLEVVRVREILETDRRSE